MLLLHQHGEYLLFCYLLATVSTVAQSIVSLSAPIVNSSSLSLTSINLHNRPIVRPLWVSRILGSEAVYWGEEKIPRGNGTFKAQENFRLKVQNIAADVVDAINTLHRSDSDRSSCALSLLGFTRLGSLAPFRGWEDRRDGPVVGVAYLKRRTHTVRCVYRAVYCNFRHGESKNTFWSVPIYCPVPEEQAALCKDFQHSAQIDQSWNLEMKLSHNSSWSTSFFIHVTDVISQQVESFVSPSSTGARVGVPHTAVCTVWPYSTSRRDKEALNQVVIVEFLRHYLQLGMKVFVYDRDGNMMRGIFDSLKTDRNSKLQRLMGQSLVYHNFTIHSLLLTSLFQSAARSATPVEFDMEDPAMNMDTDFISSLQYLDNDKELTYTHCRFEAQEKFGIERVMVVDFDEFLYCKAAAPTYSAQATYLSTFLDRMQHDKRMDQVMFGKTTLQPRYRHQNTSILQCLQREVANSGGSVFQCFSSVDCVHSKPNVKSIHLTHTCPFTGMHHSCGGCTLEHPMCKQHEQKHRFYDCICNTSTFDECDFIHLSAVASKYKSTTDTKLSVNSHSKGRKRRPNQRKNVIAPFTMKESCETSISLPCELFNMSRSSS